MPNSTGRSVQVSTPTKRSGHWRQEWAEGEDWDITELMPEERGDALGFVAHPIATASGHWLGAGARGRSRPRRRPRMRVLLKSFGNGARPCAAESGFRYIPP